MFVLKEDAAVSNSFFHFLIFQFEQPSLASEGTGNVRQCKEQIGYSPPSMHNCASGFSYTFHNFKGL